MKKALTQEGSRRLVNGAIANPNWVGAGLGDEKGGLKTRAESHTAGSADKVRKPRTVVRDRGEVKVSTAIVKWQS